MQFNISAALVIFVPALIASASLLPTSTVPAIPLAGGSRSTGTGSCHLDLSSELFGGVEAACGHPDRARCCPVLAAWLFAAHSRSALRFRPSPPPPPAGDFLPIMPETDSQRCANALQISLAAREIRLPRPNATCDAVLCFCGIRLHEMSSLTCPSAFNFNADGGSLTPRYGVRTLERDCRNASYSGCTTCLASLEKLRGGGGRNDGDERTEKMMDRNCQLMGLTWLLARNTSVYIPTVSAVFRAIMYGEQTASLPYKCSPDHENMPLAVGSLEFERAAVVSGGCRSVSRFTPVNTLYFVLFSIVAVHVGL